MRIAITGGSGLLALNWAVAMRDAHDICLLTHDHRVTLAGVEASSVVLDAPEEVGEFIRTWRPDVLVNTAGMTNVDWCESHQEEALYINAILAENVASAAQESGITLVHISTDHLFSGQMPMVDEEADPAPLNVYARTKLEGEQRVIEQCPDAVIVRTNFYGWGHRFRTSLTDWVIGSLRKGETINAFTDVWFTPILIDYLVDAVHELLSKGVTGIVNVVGDERISKYEFAMQIADVFSLDKGLINSASSQSVQFKATRPTDLSLSNLKAVKVLGHKLGSVEGGLRELKEQELDGRHNELFAAISSLTKGGI